MSNFEIFDRIVKGNNGTSKKISEVIDVERHTWSTDSGNIIMKHEGVLYLRKFTGAKFLKPELQIQISNPGNVVYLCAVQFPDGEISYEIGESNNENTRGWSKGIKPTMAFKRGFDRAFLRSDNIGLFEVYSEEESDDFKRPFHQQTPSEFETQIPLHNQSEVVNSDFKTNVTEKKVYDFPPKETLFLPGTDVKYPGQNILDDICKVHKDFDYLEEILKNYPNNKDYVKASNLMLEFLKTKVKSEKAKQEEAEAFLNSGLEEKNQHEDIGSLETTEEMDTVKVIETDEVIESGEVIETDEVVSEEQISLFNFDEKLEDNIDSDDVADAEAFLNSDLPKDNL